MLLETGEDVSHGKRLVAESVMRWRACLKMSELLRWVSFAVVLLFACTARAEFDHTHKTWNQLLQQNVVPLNEYKASAVRYSGLSKHRAQHAFDWYLGALSAVPTATFNTWSRAQQLAFLINAYNAYTIKRVLQHYPISSIRDIDGAPEKTMRKGEFFRLLGSERSLDELEHELINAFEEPRVHFALNCATAGCPMLREEAYVAERLDRQLEEQATRFLSDRSRNRYDEKTHTAEVSQLFDWHADDFVRNSGSVKGYLTKYAAQLGSTPAAQEAIVGQRYELGFMPYDWRLNDAR